jgi:hypothetical protein
MSKKLLSESQVTRWHKLANIKSDRKVLNEMGMGMSGKPAYAREDEDPMAAGDEAGDMADMGMDAEADMGGEDMGDLDLGMGAEEAAAEDMEMSVDDDKLMNMIQDAVRKVLEDAGLVEDEAGGEMEDMEMETEEEDTEGEEAEGGGDALSAEPGEGEEEEEAPPIQEVEVVTNDEIINETLKRVIRRLRK